MTASSRDSCVGDGDFPAPPGPHSRVSIAWAATAAEQGSGRTAWVGGARHSWAALIDDSGASVPLLRQCPRADVRVWHGGRVALHRLMVWRAAWSRSHAVHGCEHDGDDLAGLAPSGSRESAGRCGHRALRTAPRRAWVGSVRVVALRRVRDDRVARAGSPFPVPRAGSPDVGGRRRFRQSRRLDFRRPRVRNPSPAPHTRASIPVMKAGAIPIDTDALRHDGQRRGRALLQGAS